ncbi:hypothetical protein D9M68_716130 [compost metagenome]
MVTMPRSWGQPISCAMATKSSSSDRPVITSGITSGAVTMPPNSVRPRKRGMRVSTKAARVPRATAAIAVYKAISRERPTEFISWVLSRRPTYHFTDQPPQTVTSLEALKE